MVVAVYSDVEVLNAIHLSLEVENENSNGSDSDRTLPEVKVRVKEERIKLSILILARLQKSLRSSLPVACDRKTEEKVH